MRHYVLTRSVYGIGWTLEANARRLAITRGITVACMKAQTNRSWTWVVLIDPTDPLVEERKAAFLSAGVPVIFIEWHPAALEPAAWDKHPHTVSLVGKVAATAYKAPWAQAIRVGHGTILQTRLDDDDGFAPDALARIRATADKARYSRRVVWMFPLGVRVWHGSFVLAKHTTNAWATLQTPPGDILTVYDYGHRLVERIAPVRIIDRRPAWLWSRHRDTLSGWRRVTQPLTWRIRAMFPIDWKLLT